MSSFAPLSGGPLSSSGSSSAAITYNADSTENSSALDSQSVTVTLSASSAETTLAQDSQNAELALSANNVESTEAVDSQEATVSTIAADVLESAVALEEQASILDALAENQESSLALDTQSVTLTADVLIEESLAIFDSQQGSAVIAVLDVLETSSATDTQSVNLTYSSQQREFISALDEQDAVVTTNGPGIVIVPSNARVGSRRKLLSPYLESDLWMELVDSIDELFAVGKIDDSKRQLQLLRSPINTGDLIFQANADAGRLTRLEDVESLERDTIIRHANMLGFTFTDASLLEVQDYLRIAQYIASYYAETKGTQGWQDFLGFCLNAQFRVTTLWTQDYVEFIEEGDPEIGYPVYEGGTWYPTTHVVLSYDPTRFNNLSQRTVYQFFYYFANINLVLEYLYLEIDGSMGVQVSVNGYLEVEV